MQINKWMQTPKFPSMRYVQPNPEEKILIRAYQIDSTLY